MKSLAILLLLISCSSDKIRHHKGHEVTVSENSFENADAARVFFFNRRLNYQKSYEQVIEPYFGKSAASECTDKVDVSGVITEQKNGDLYYSMKIISNKFKNLSACDPDNMTFHTFVENHLINNKVIEVKIFSRKYDLDYKSPILNP